MFKKDFGDRRLNQPQKWYPRDVNTAKAVTYFNLSVAHVVRSEIDIALKNFNLVNYFFFDFDFVIFTFFFQILNKRA